MSSWRKSHIPSPCLDCEKRHYKCHSECEDYIAFRAKIDAVNAEKRVKNDIQTATIEMAIRRKEK